MSLKKKKNPNIVQVYNELQEGMPWVWPTCDSSHAITIQLKLKSLLLRQHEHKQVPSKIQNLLPAESIFE